MKLNNKLNLLFLSTLLAAGANAADGGKVTLFCEVESSSSPDYTKRNRMITISENLSAPEGRTEFKLSEFDPKAKGTLELSGYIRVMTDGMLAGRSFYIFNLVVISELSAKRQIQATSTVWVPSEQSGGMVYKSFITASTLIPQEGDYVIGEGSQNFSVECIKFGN